VSKQASSPPPSRVGLLAGAVREAQLWWRLWRDGRVPLWTRAIPILTVLYILFPFDLITDLFVGLGQLDDLAVFILGMELFVSMSPAEVVDELRREILSRRRSTATGAEGRAGEVDTVDAAYRVVNEGRADGSRRDTGVTE
jgi:uncharacterized membrane protein YkvA (DUF1232 family)